MTAPSDSEAFYAGVPVRRGFRSLMDPARYTPLPDDWTVGIADVVAVDQGDRGEALQGRQHGRRRRDRGGDQRARRARISVRVRRRRRGFRGVAARRRGGRARRWRRRRPGPTASSASLCGSRSFRSPPSASKGSTCAWRATGRRRISPTRCFPAAGSPGPMPRSSAANSRSRRRRPAPGPISPACPAGSRNSAPSAG